MKICAIILTSNIDGKKCLEYPTGMEIAWLKKSGFELSSWPSIYICTYFHSWIVSSLAEIFEEIGRGCVDWKHLVHIGFSYRLLWTGKWTCDFTQGAKFLIQLGVKELPKNNYAPKSLLVRKLWDAWNTGKKTVYFLDIQRTMHHDIFL